MASGSCFVDPHWRPPCLEAMGLLFILATRMLIIIIVRIITIEIIILLSYCNNVIIVRTLTRPNVRQVLL